MTTSNTSKFGYATISGRRSVFVCIVKSGNGDWDKNDHQYIYNLLGNGTPESQPECISELIYCLPLTLTKEEISAGKPNWNVVEARLATFNKNDPKARDILDYMKEMGFLKRSK